MRAGEKEGATATAWPAFGVLQSMRCWVFPQSRKNLLRSNTAKPIRCSTRPLRAVDAVDSAARVGLVVVRRRGRDTQFGRAKSHALMLALRPCASAALARPSIVNWQAGVAPGPHHSLFPNPAPIVSSRRGSLPRIRPGLFFEIVTAARVFILSPCAADDRPDWMLRGLPNDALQSGHRNSVNDSRDQSANRLEPASRSVSFASVHNAEVMERSEQCLSLRVPANCWQARDGKSIPGVAT